MVCEKYGHKIKKLFAATTLDWSDIEVEYIELYSDAVLSQALRYRRKTSPILTSTRSMSFCSRKKSSIAVSRTSVQPRRESGPQGVGTSMNRNPRRAIEIVSQPVV